MISKVHIKNFKTLKDLAFPCTRMNIFIGDTDTGKTNIIEALTLLSRASTTNGKLDKRLIRYDDIEDLFPMQDMSEAMIIDIDRARATMTGERGLFKLTIEDMSGGTGVMNGDLTSHIGPDGTMHGDLFHYGTDVLRYAYDPEVIFGHNTMKELEPPSGPNLPGLLATNKQLRSRISQVLEGTGVRLEVRLQENALRLSNLIDDNVVVSMPYANVSGSLKHYLFMHAILGSVQGHVLLFDGPLQHTSAFHCQHMAELMALDKKNQYFITTHDQYLLSALLDKAPADEIQVFATFRKDRYTEVRPIPMDQLQDLMQYDLFLNLDKLAEV